MLIRAQMAPLSSSVKELIGHTLNPLLEMYETEDDKLVLRFLPHPTSSSVMKP